MKKKEMIKYVEIISQYEQNHNGDWRQVLKQNLKNQEDMNFINTPDFSKRRAVTSKLNVMEEIEEQIFVYNAFVKSGKYNIVVFDCLDQTMWFKTVVIGNRKRQIYEPLCDTEIKWDNKCKLKFVK